MAKSKKLLLGAAAVCLLAGAAAIVCLRGGGAVKIGTSRQFAWNTALFDAEQTTATLTQHSPQKQEQVLTMDSAWEGSRADAVNIVSDGSGYKMYYITYNTADDAKVCLAQSEDGITWEKPNLGLVEQDGSTENNILLSGGAFAGGFYVLYDSSTHAGDAAYKAVAVDQSGQMVGYTSQNGLQWALAGDLGAKTKTNITAPATLCSVFWNEADQRYDCYYATESGIMRTSSKDFIKWGTPKKISIQSEDAFTLQTANIQPYSRSDSMRIGLPLRVTNATDSEIQANFADSSARSNALTDTVFMASTDGKTFSLTPEAWLTPGAQTETNWLFGDSYVAGGMVQTPSLHSENGEDDELSFYVAENMLSDEPTSLSRYTLRMDGFASYNAPYSTRKVTTKPLVFDGSRMTVNFSTSTDGYVYVRILDKNGQPFEELEYTDQNGESYTVPKYTSYKMLGDRVDREVAFNGDLSELAGQTVVLEFYLSDADLYSFRFDDEPYENDTDWQPQPIEERDYEDFHYSDVSEPIDIGTQRQVLWDDYLIDPAGTSAAMVSHSPVRKERLFQTDLPWEGDNCDFYVILDDEDALGQPYHRMYYLGWDSSASEDIRVCYAYSYDGSEWIKPDLGLHSYTDPATGEVYEQTNIMLYTEEEMFDNFFVMKDTRPGVPDSERYKAICQGSYDQQGYSSFGLWGWVSADGLHWTKTHRQLPQLDEWFGAFDSVNGLVWDEDSQQFFTYFRVREKQQVGDTEWPDFRKIYGATAPEFEPMSTDTIFALNYGENAPLFEMYTNNISKYYRAPQMFIGFPTRFSRNNIWQKNYDYLTDPEARREKFDAGQETRTLSMTDAMLMTSRDGYTWNRQNEAYITPGPEYQANWIYGNCYPAYGLVQTKSDRQGADDELSMYLFEGKFYHEPSVLYRYTLRLDGFKSYKSTYAPQTVTTKTLTFSGSEMQVNFKTSAAGSLQIRILDESGNPIEGYTTEKLIGDNTDRTVTFKNNLTALNGQTVKIEFTLSDAELYAFKFA